MEKVGDSQSSSEPVVPTSKETKKRKKGSGVLKVKVESSEICLEKIKGVLTKLRETGDIEAWYEKTVDGTVLVLGYVDPEKLRTELQNEAGDAIKSITHLPESKGIPYCSFSGKIPRMSVPEVANRRMEVLKHSTEIEKDQATNNSRKRVCYWIEKFGRVGKKPEMGDARGSGCFLRCMR